MAVELPVQLTHLMRNQNQMLTLMKSLSLVRHLLMTSILCNLQDKILYTDNCGLEAVFQ